jgi:aminoglycoside N3'-acetyltransferase
MPEPPVTYHDIIYGLQQLGLMPGATVEVHSSLSAFGWVEDGAPTVISALMDVLHHGQIGQAQCHYFKARSVVAIYKHWRQTDPYGLFGVYDLD